MRSGRTKVLNDVCGRPSLWHVLRAARACRPATIAVVVGLGDEIESAVRAWDIRPEPRFVLQEPPLGTGHAVSVAEEATEGADDVLVLAGDDPLVTPAHVRELLRVHRRTRAAATILTATLADPKGYARVIRDGTLLVDLVVEDVADSMPALRGSGEVSTLVYAFRREDLFRALPAVGKDNRQREHYLPDVLGILRDKGERLSAVHADLGGALGLNSQAGLADVSRIMRARIVEGHMARGVTFVDPDTTYVDVDVRIGSDTRVLPSTIIQGTTRIGRRCVVGPGTRIVDSTVGDDAEVTFSVVKGSRLGSGATVGPYASLRPGTVLEEGAKAGTFVEIKASRVGRDSKVPHLSYVGDARIGRGTNVGAATVTANYDGFEKHRTVIGDEVHIGSDTMLVAPVRVGNRAWTGAGSVITRDVPAGALAVERTDQRTVRGYDDRRRAMRAKEGQTASPPKPAEGSKKTGGRRRG